MNPWGDYWGPTASAVIDGHLYEFWKPERAEFHDPGTRVPATEALPGVFAIPRERLTRPVEPMSRREWPRVCTIEDWLGTPFTHEDSMLTIEHHVSGVPAEPMLWWEIYRGWEPEAGILAGWEIEIARASWRHWAKDDRL